MRLEDVEKLVDETARRLAEKEEERRRANEYVAELDKILEKVRREGEDIRTCVAMYLLDALKELLPPAQLAPLLLTAIFEVADMLRTARIVAERLAPVVVDRAKQLEEMK